MQALGPKKTVVFAYHFAADLSPYQNEELSTLKINEKRNT